jgi:hypothetical protein
MATRTISNTGGNYNATGTWVEGVVPTSADDVVSTATSGQLTINVTSAARSIDLTSYVSTLTMNANWTISGSGTTNTFGVGMNFAGLIGNLIFSVAVTLVQNTTNRIPRLQITAAVIRTLSSNLYVVDLITSAGTINGNIIYVSGNIGTAGSLASSVTGTTKFILDGSGLVSVGIYSNPIEINTTGTYSTYGQGLFLTTISGSPTASFTFTAGNIGNFNIILDTFDGASGTANYKIDLKRKVSGVYVVNEAKSINNSDIRIDLMGEYLNTDIFASYDINRPFTTDVTVPNVFILNGGLSASQMVLTPSWRTTSAAALTAPAFTYKGINLRLNSEYTHNIGSIKAIGGAIPDKPTISSITASTVAYINLLSKITSQIVDYNFTDINATGEQIVAISGTISNCTNVTSIYGGGTASSGGGSWTFIN